MTSTRRTSKEPTTRAPSSSSSSSSSPPSSSSFSNLLWLVGGFVVTTCAKVLLFPSYYSTDLLVHRHWKAVTRHLMRSNWYYDDLHVHTVHTLDYPPLFAMFESLLSNNPITNYLLRHHILDDRCLQLLSDADLASHPPSTACVTFLRSTVVVSDVLLWIGAWMIATVVTASSTRSGSELTTTTTTTKRWALFLLIVLHPGLLWLDHVHFQYNGMLLGLLLISLSFLVKEASQPSDLLTSALGFALLLNLKHLYVTLAPWYFFYLLRAYCFDNDNRNGPPRFQFGRLVRLGLVTVVALAVPWLVVVGSSPEPGKLMSQIVQRLFPFQRGLVHDYWAANVWAIAMAAGKVAKVAALAERFPPVPAFDENTVKPTAVAVLLLLLLLLGGWQAWKAAATRSRSRLVVSFAFSALASFQVGYHVHEKAIMTTLLPMLFVPFLPMSRNNKVRYNPYPLLLWEMTAWGLLGLFPLLYESRELTLKLTSYGAYVAILYFVCFEWDLTATVYDTPPSRIWVGLHLVGLATTIGVLEIVPVSAWGRYEYAPLAFTSVLCACALGLATIRLAYHLFVTLDDDAP